MGDSPRLRFAPSPTGYLHIGGARSALYNWLWARKTGGTFVVRVEDTDQERSTDESTKIVLDSLRWLGLDWDEGPDVGGDRGPYFQTERRDLYAEYAEKLIEAGAAYRCYATKEEIAEARTAFEKSGGKGFRFRSPWRDKHEVRAEPHVVRLRAPTEGKTGWDDLIKGRIDYPNRQQQDSILLRSDGLPLYNLGCMVDDLTMGITLVARGDDHLVNTPIQILLYKALGAEVPQFAHMPMILGSKGQKLSKRHASVGVFEYRDQGFLPDGVLNYLVRLGWSHGDQEIFSRDELIEKFGWEHVGKTGAKYDLKKFEYVQAEHLRAMDNDKVAALAVRFLKERGLEVDAADPRLATAIGYVKPRVTTLRDVAEHVDYFFREAIEYDEKAEKKFLTSERALTLRSLRTLLSEVEPWENENLGVRVRAWMEAEGLSMKDFAQATRLALTGRTKSPGLFEVMDVLGKDVSLGRLDRAIGIAEQR